MYVSCDFCPIIDLRCWETDPAQIWWRERGYPHLNLWKIHNFSFYNRNAREKEWEKKRLIVKGSSLCQWCVLLREVTESSKTTLSGNLVFFSFSKNDFRHLLEINDPLKWMNVTRDSTFIYWMNAKDCACVIVSQYRNALQSNNIVAVTREYSHQFLHPAESSTRNESKI